MMMMMEICPNMTWGMSTKPHPPNPPPNLVNPDQDQDHVQRVAQQDAPRHPTLGPGHHEAPVHPADLAQEAGQGKPLGTTQERIGF